MIKVVKGNLLNATEKVIAHQVNCQKKMYSGVAKTIRENYPIVFDIYKQTEPQMGLAYFVYDAYDCDYKNKHHIVNMYAQNMYGYDGLQYTDYEAFKKCCKSIVETCKHIERNSDEKCDVAMPYKIASDRGGADWDTIMDILLEEFTDVDLTLYKL